jgi:hypothetical protein
MNKQVRRDKRVMRTISIGGKRKQTDIQSRFSEAIQVIFLEMTWQMFVLQSGHGVFTSRCINSGSTRVKSFFFSFSMTDFVGKFFAFYGSGICGRWGS